MAQRPFTGNGYTWFLDEQKAKDLKKYGGLRFNQLQHLFDADYNKLSQEEKAVYKEKARKAKANGDPWPSSVVGRNAGRGRGSRNQFNVQSQNVARDLKFEEKMNNQMLIEQAVQFYDSKDWLQRLTFAIVDVHTWLDADFVKSEEGLPPAEFAMIEVSLEDGISSSKNLLIHPGQIPLGRRADLVLQTSKEHKIELECPKLNDNWPGVVDHIADFLNRVKNDDYYLFKGQVAEKGRNPPVFILAMSDRIELIEHAMTWLWLKTDRNDRDNYKVLPLPFLLQTFAKNVSGHEGHRERAVNALESFKWFVAQGVSCSLYHEDTESENKYCALGRCKVLWYRFCDYLANYCDIEIMPGRHIPPNF